jgi:hypothetical protein
MRGIPQTAVQDVGDAGSPSASDVAFNEDIMALASEAGAGNNVLEQGLSQGMANSQAALSLVREKT